jgi:hypothetical protein
MEDRIWGDGIGNLLVQCWRFKALSGSGGARIQSQGGPSIFFSHTEDKVLINNTNSRCL